MQSSARSSVRPGPWISLWVVAFLSLLGQLYICQFFTFGVMVPMSIDVNPSNLWKIAYHFPPTGTFQVLNWLGVANLPQPLNPVSWAAGHWSIWWFFTFYTPLISTLALLAMVVFLLLPESKYHRSRLEGVYSPKAMTLMRITFITLVNSGLGWTTYLTGRSAVLNYIALWIVPTGAALALIVIRQWRQHGNLPPGQVAWDRHPGLLGRLLLFPLNQHRHRAKHASPQVPWFELPVS